MVLNEALPRVHLEHFDFFFSAKKADTHSQNVCCGLQLLTFCLLLRHNAKMRMCFKVR